MLTYASVLEKKGTRVNTGGKNMGEVKGKVRRVTRIVADHTTTHSLGERYGEFCE
jgi:hypothetical protein